MGKNYRTRATINGSFGAQNSSQNNLRISYGKGNLTVSNIKGISLEDFGDSNLDRFNSKYLKRDYEIIASSSNDKINARTGDDFIWGNKGDNSLSGGAGNDLLVGGKVMDFLTGGAGRDAFGITKEFGKGENNLDIISDFQIGIDRIYVSEGSKGLWIDNYDGDAVIVSGKKDVIARIDGAGGKLTWSDDRNFIM